MWKRFMVFIAVLFLLPGVFAFGAEKACDRACLDVADHEETYFFEHSPVIHIQ